MFTPLLDDVYELTTSAPTPIDGGHRRRLEPEAVVNLDWHNDMSELILDINEAIEAAADDTRPRRHHPAFAAGAGREMT